MSVRYVWFYATITYLGAYGSVLLCLWFSLFVGYLTPVDLVFVICGCFSVFLVWLLLLSVVCVWCLFCLVVFCDSVVWSLFWLFLRVFGFRVTWFASCCLLWLLMFGFWWLDLVWVCVGVNWCSAYLVCFRFDFVLMNYLLGLLVMVVYLFVLWLGSLSLNVGIVCFKHFGCCGFVLLVLLLVGCSFDRLLHWCFVYLWFDLSLRCFVLPVTWLLSCILWIGCSVELDTTLVLCYYWLVFLV